MTTEQTRNRTGKDRDSVRQCRHDGERAHVNRQQANPVVPREHTDMRASAKHNTRTCSCRADSCCCCCRMMPACTAAARDITPVSLPVPAPAPAAAAAPPSAASAAANSTKRLKRASSSPRSSDRSSDRRSGRCCCWPCVHVHVTHGQFPGRHNKRRTGDE